MIKKLLEYSFLVLICFYFQGCKLDPCSSENPCAIDEAGNAHGEPLEDFRDCVCLCDQYWYGDVCSVPCFKGTFNNTTGRCDCSTYFEGYGCQTKWRSKFLDNDSESSWTVSDSCFLGVSYEGRLGTFGNDHLTIFNLGNISGNASGIAVELINSLKFRQTGEDTIGSYTISQITGLISSDGNKIQVTYTAEVGSNVLNCSAIWIRR